MQQVNLYLPRLKPKRELLSLDNSLLLVLAIILLLGLACYKRWHTVLFEESLARQLEQKAALLKMDDALARDRPPANEKAELEAAIEGLKTAAQNRHETIAMIERLRSDQSSLSAQLESIRKTLPSSVKLQTFGLYNAGANAFFTGHTTRDSDVPLFLERLFTEPSFSESLFGPMSITKINDQSLFKVGQEPGAEAK